LANRYNVINVKRQPITRKKPQKKVAVYNGLKDLTNNSASTHSGCGQISNDNKGKIRPEKIIPKILRYTAFMPNFIISSLVLNFIFAF